MVFDKVLQCSIIENTDRYKGLFKRGRKKFQYFNKYKAYVEKKNKPLSKEETRSYVEHLLKKEEKKRADLKKLKIKYDFPGFVMINNSEKSN